MTAQAAAGRPHSRGTTGRATANHASDRRPDPRSSQRRPHPGSGQRRTGDLRGAAIRTILFDLDGTLVDSKELILSSYRHTMGQHLGAPRPDGEWLATMGRPLLDQLRAFARDERQARTMMDTYQRHNVAVHDELIRPFPGVRRTLRHLRERGYRLGIVTSKLSDGARRGLCACELPEGWFAALVCPDDLELHKPDPAPVLEALRLIGEPEPARAIFIGDSIYDLRAGRAAGTFTAAALWGPYGRTELGAEEPDVWLERIEDIWAALGDEPPCEAARPPDEQDRRVGGP